MSSLPTGNFSDLYDVVPLHRQFWKAGEYEAEPALKPLTHNGQNRLRVHPKFLHSNATSHKWAFGAIAELLDNAVDEVQNGATSVIIDNITNPRSGEDALLVQDDGGGLDPNLMRCCMSFGFSNKQADVSIGQYGNGFKTSTMRLGADVIVFSRSMKKGTTHTVGLLSYTFLRDIASDDVMVPMVDYEFHSKDNDFKGLFHGNQSQFSSNLSAILKWSPFATEHEMLKQFEGIGLHGTKIIIFNLWVNDDGCMELDFASDAEDIMVTGAPKDEKTKYLRKILYQNHIANRFRYSLRVYASILYLHLPENFKIILRGKVVQPHHIATDLRYVECIKYKPHGVRGDEVITQIGFLEGAPILNVHGFCVYHRNRLILPFWSVVKNSSQSRRSSGVAGVLEANHIRPTHDKQDFEKSTLHQKLETRLRDMTIEYWNCHCHLISYQTGLSATSEQFFTDSKGSSQSNSKGISQKRRRDEHVASVSTSKKQATGQAPAGLENNHQNQHECSSGPRKSGESDAIMQQNRKLRAECLDYENTEKKLILKAERLRKELQEYEQLHCNLMIQLKSMDDVKVKLEVGMSMDDINLRL